MVGSRLRHHHDADHRNAVHLHIAARILRSQLRAAHVAQTDDAVGVLAHHQIVELLRGVHQSQRADGQLGGVALDASRRQLDVLPVERALDVRRRDAVSGHLGRIEPQSHRITLLAPYLHAAHVADRLQLLLDRQVGVGLGHRRRGAVAGQVTLRARHLVAHVVGSRFEVYRKFEFDRDAALALTADARHRPDAGNAVDILFEGFGDLVLDHIGVGARIGARHRDDRIVHARKLPHAQIAVSDKAE